MDPRKTPNRPNEKLPDDAPALPDLPSIEEQDDRHGRIRGKDGGRLDEV